MTEENEREEEFTDINAEETSEETTSESTEIEIPEKYAGKSTADLVQILVEKEKFQGKQSQEVGDLRKIVDNYIQQQSAQLEDAPQEEEFDETDFFSNPKDAVSRMVQNHPTVKQAQKVSEDYTRQASMQQLQQAHPDMMEIIQNPEFARWVEADEVRTELFVKADQQFDVKAANNLFNTWKDRKGYVAQTKEIEDIARQQATKKAAVGGGRSSTESKGKPIYKRSDVVNMMVERPDEYKRKLPDIRQAYAEGRVR